MWILNRINGNQEVYRNKAQLASETQAVSDSPNSNVYVLCYSNNGNPINFVTKQFSCFFIGTGLNQTKINNITDAFETAMDALGKGVIS